MLSIELPVRLHHLKAFGRSGLHGRMSRAGEEADPTAAMERGSGTDELLLPLLGGEGRVIAYPGAVRRGKEWEAFQAAHPDTIILTAKEYEKAARMADAVRAHDLAAHLLEGEQRKTIEWSWMGRTCSGTPDARTAEHITDLKTTVSSEPDKFTWQALRLGYHAQLAWYLQGVAQSGLGQPRDAYIVAVESSAPWPVTVLRLTPRALGVGARLVRLWMERLLSCEAAGAYPAYCEAIVDLDVPSDEQDLDYGDVAEAVG